MRDERFMTEVLGGTRRPPARLQHTIASRGGRSCGSAAVFAAVVFLQLMAPMAAAQEVANPPQTILAQDPTGGSQTAPGMADEALTPPADPALAAEIDELIPKLGSPLFREREAATAHLLDIGIATFAQLSAAYKTTDELEVKLRVERIVRDAYLNHYVYDRNGFLGVSQWRMPVAPEEHPAIPRGHIGIRVTDVIENTAAERAGIERDDVIIALDGEPIQDHGLDTVTVFGERIRQRGPGALMKVTVLREMHRVEFDVTLGRRPPVYYGVNQSVVHELLQEHQRAYRALWARHFLGQSMEDSDE
jgi:hypothetical protein